MIFYPKICWFTRFVVNCRESNLRTFCREIHQCAKIGGRGGQVNLGNARSFSGFSTATPPFWVFCNSFEPLGSSSGSYRLITREGVQTLSLPPDVLIEWMFEYTLIKCRYPKATSQLFPRSKLWGGRINQKYPNPSSPNQPKMKTIYNVSFDSFIFRNHRVCKWREYIHVGTMFLSKYSMLSRGNSFCKDYTFDTQPLYILGQVMY